MASARRDCFDPQETHRHSMAHASASFLYTISSLVIVLTSIGFLAYLFAMRNLRPPGFYDPSAIEIPLAVAIDPKPTRGRVAVSRVIDDVLLKKRYSQVQLASSIVQEPGQSDPNKPPPLTPSKKGPSAIPPARIPSASEPSNPASSGTSNSTSTPAATKPTERAESGTANSKAEMANDSKDSSSGATASGSSAPAASPSSSASSSTEKDAAGKSSPAPSVPNTGGNKSAGSQSATPPATPPNNNGNSTIKELGAFVRKKLTPVFEGGVFGSYSLDVLSTENTGATSIRFTDDISKTSRERVVDSHYGIGQRVSLGIRGSLVGYRASYTNFLEETSRFDRPDFRSIWPDLSSMSRIDMHIADIEITQKHAINDICLESFFGVRYADYRGADMAVGVGKFATNLEAHAIAHSYRETEGIGPTFGLSARRHLPWKFGCGMFESCQTNDCGNLGWNWFWTLRGSVLRSRLLSSAFTESQVGIYSPATGVQGVARSSDKSYLDHSSEMNLFNGEFQIGLEYCRPLEFIPATASIRTSLVCQYWDTGPGVSTSQSFAELSGNSPDFSGRVDSFAISDNRFMNLFGLNVTMGLNY